jgi:hypothetical protein
MKLSKKIINCLIDFHHMESHELNDIEKNILEKDKDLVILWNKSLSNSQLAFYNSLRKIFSNDKSPVFDKLPDSIKNQFLLLKQEVITIKKYINTVVLHDDELNKVPLSYNGFSDMFNNIIIPLANLLELVLQDEDPKKTKQIFWWFHHIYDGTNLIKTYKHDIPSVKKVFFK